MVLILLRNIKMKMILDFDGRKKLEAYLQLLIIIDKKKNLGKLAKAKDSKAKVIKLKSKVKGSQKQRAPLLLKMFWESQQHNGNCKIYDRYSSYYFNQRDVQH